MMVTVKRGVCCFMLFFQIRLLAYMFVLWTHLVECQYQSIVFAILQGVFIILNGEPVNTYKR